MRGIVITVVRNFRELFYLDYGVETSLRRWCIVCLKV